MTAPHSDSHGHGHPAPHGPGTPRGHGDATEEVSQVGVEMLAKLWRGKNMNGPEHALAIAIKDDPVREAMAKTAARLGVEAVITVVGTVLTALFPTVDATRALNMLERLLTGATFGNIDRLSEMSEEEIEAHFQSQAAAHVVDHTAAVAVGVPSALRYIGVFGVAADRLIHRANVTPAGALDVYPMREGVRNDQVVPRANCVGYSNAYDRHWLLHPLAESTETVTPRAAAPARGAREAASTRTTVKVVTTPFDVRQMDIEEAVRLTTANEFRWCPICYPDPAHEIAEARAARARGSDASHGAHGHEDAHAPAAPAAPRKSLLQLAREGGYEEVVRVLSALTRTKLNPAQLLRKTDLLGDVERAGASQGVLEALNEFCEEIPDNRVLSSDEVDSLLTWMDDNIPGVQEDAATTWRGWFWQQRRNAARYWRFALFALVASLVIAAVLAFLVWYFALRPVWGFFIGAFKAGDVNTADPGGWAYNTTVKWFQAMMAGDLTTVFATTLLLAILCTVVSVFGQMLLRKLGLAPDVHVNPNDPNSRLVPAENFRDVGRNTVQFLTVFAALHFWAVMHGVPPDSSVILVGAMVGISFSGRMAYVAQKGMDATIRDNNRKTNQFLMFVLVPELVFITIVQFAFATETAAIRSQVSTFVTQNGLAVLGVALLGSVWLYLTTHPKATAEDKRGYNTVVMYVAIGAVLMLFGRPVTSYVGGVVSDTYHGVTESAARGWTHFLNPSDSWSKAPSSGVKTPTTPSAAPAKVAVPGLPMPSVPVQASPAHLPAPAAATSTNPALKRFCDGLGPVQRSQTTTCKGI